MADRAEPEIPQGLANGLKAASLSDAEKPPTPEITNVTSCNTICSRRPSAIGTS
jgi:hypothetical protein